MYTVEVKGDSEWTKQSEYTSYSDAVNQASLVQGRVVGPHPGVIDDDAHLYAVSKQGFSGDYAEWQRQGDVSRDAFASEVTYRICRGRGIPGRPASCARSRCVSCVLRPEAIWRAIDDMMDHMDECRELLDWSD